MSVEQILLIMTSGLLTVLALVASFFLGAEIVRALRDVFTPRTRAADETEGSDGPLRQITPFRDRETVQRIIDHLEDEETPQQEAP